MMSQLQNDVRSLMGPPRTRARAHGHGNYIASCIALALLTIASWIATLSMLRSGRNVLGDMVPGWPWW